MITYKTGRLPVKVWANDVEDSAKGQIKNLSNHPGAFHHIAIMPDVHMGYGMPIGGVVAFDEMVVPNAVGVDIGCGMCAVNTNIPVPDTDMIKTILGKIREKIPVGFNHRDEPCSISEMPVFPASYTPVIVSEFESARKQLGTLGGGNHFIELQKDCKNILWVMIHSGSRNLGFKVANKYNKDAIALNARFSSSVPKEHELSFLPIGTKEATSYIAEMNYCLEFALASRLRMMNDVVSILSSVFGSVWPEPIVNIHHNYASIERHFGRDVWVHRKGATLAREGTVGIIPGSQGTKSYIVKGRGNKDSFDSCSHGAGRLMSRKKAKETLSLEDEQKKLNDAGIIHSVRNKQDLDEAPSCYKDIQSVMEQQKDLVDILVELTPLAVIKG